MPPVTDPTANPNPRVTRRSDVTRTPSETGNTGTVSTIGTTADTDVTILDGTQLQTMEITTTGGIPEIPATTQGGAASINESADRLTTLKKRLLNWEEQYDKRYQHIIDNDLPLKTDVMLTHLQERIVELKTEIKEYDAPVNTPAASTSSVSISHAALERKHSLLSLAKQHGVPSLSKVEQLREWFEYFELFLTNNASLLLDDDDKIYLVRSLSTGLRNEMSRVSGLSFYSEFKAKIFEFYVPKRTVLDEALEFLSYHRKDELFLTYRDHFARCALTLGLDEKSCMYKALFVQKSYSGFVSYLQEILSSEKIIELFNMSWLDFLDEIEFHDKNYFTSRVLAGRSQNSNKSGSSSSKNVKFNTSSSSTSTSTSTSSSSSANSGQPKYPILGTDKLSKLIRPYNNSELPEAPPNPLMSTPQWLKVYQLPEHLKTAKKNGNLCGMYSCNEVRDGSHPITKCPHFWRFCLDYAKEGRPRYTNSPTN